MQVWFERSFIVMEYIGYEQSSSTLLRSPQMLNAERHTRKIIALKVGASDTAVLDTHAQSTAKLIFDDIFDENFLTCTGR